MARAISAHLHVMLDQKPPMAMPSPQYTTGQQVVALIGETLDGAIAIAIVMNGISLMIRSLLLLKFHVKKRFMQPSSNLRFCNRALLFLTCAPTSAHHLLPAATCHCSIIHIQEEKLQGNNT